MTNTIAPRSKATIQRQARLTDAFKVKMHRLWHQVRGLPVCENLACEHPWYPA